MALFNDFRLIGTAYDNAKEVFSNNVSNKRHADFVLVTKSNVDTKKNVYVPIIAYGKVADLALHIARRENVIAVEGEIVTKEFFNKETGSLTVRIFFLAYDISLIRKKPIKTDLDEQKKFGDLIALHTID